MSTEYDLDYALDFTDRTDARNVRRGLIDKLEPCVVRDEAGRVVWDGERWAFLDDDACPESVNPSLWRQSRHNIAHGLFEVVEGVYQVRGLDVANMTIIEGPEGIVVVDPLVSKETAAAGLDLYRRNRGGRDERPVRAVLYTHSHGDHFGGVHGVTTPEAVAAGEVAIVAPDEFMHHAVSENVFAGTAMRRRAVYMYGRSLSANPRGTVGFGIAQELSSGTIGLIPPTETITATGRELTLAGVRFVFQLTPDTEAPSEMNFYLPDSRVLLISENVNHTLHNVLTLRGAQVRDAHAWATYITESIQLFEDAQVLIGSHQWPTWGGDEVLAHLTGQRDAYAYIHDQTVRLMNKGLTGAEIAEEITAFPGELGRAWHARGYYGSISQNVRAVYQFYMGWYDGNPAHLWPHPPVEQAERYVALAGGVEAAIAAARKAYEDGDLRWAAELLGHVLFAAGENEEARRLEADVFERLGFAAENGTWRNIYLTGAKELRENTRQGASAHGASLDLLAALSTRQVFDAMAVRLDGPRAAAHRLLLRWQFTDTRETWTLLVGNGVLTPIPGDAPRGEQPHVTLTLERAFVNRVLAAQTSFAEGIQAGAIRVEGDAAVLRVFQSLLDQAVPDFPIVTR